MRIVIDTSDLDALERDALAAAVEMARAFDGAADELSADGLRIAKANARRSSGDHGVHYPRAGTRRHLAIGVYEFFPDPSKRQGGMDFEMGSGRQSAPHFDYTKASDVIAGKAAQVVTQHVDRALRRLA